MFLWQIAYVSLKAGDCQLVNQISLSDHNFQSIIDYSERYRSITDGIPISSNFQLLRCTYSDIPPIPTLGKSAPIHPLDKHLAPSAEQDPYNPRSADTAQQRQFQHPFTAPLPATQADTCP